MSECIHKEVVTFRTEAGEPVPLWACSKCKTRFEPIGPWMEREKSLQARIEALEEVPAIVCVVAALQAYGYTIPSGWVLPTTHKSPYWEQCWRKALLEGE